jgi:hypothetical protein
MFGLQAIQEGEGLGQNGAEQALRHVYYLLVLFVCVLLIH